MADSVSKKDAAIIGGGMLVGGIIIGCLLCRCRASGQTPPPPPPGGQTISIETYPAVIHLNQEVSNQSGAITWGADPSTELVTGTSTGFSEFANFNVWAGDPTGEIGSVGQGTAGPAVSWYSELGLEAKLPSGQTETVQITLQAKNATGTVVSDKVDVSVVIGA